MGKPLNYFTSHQLLKENLLHRVIQHPHAVRSALLNYPYTCCYCIWHGAFKFTPFCSPWNQHCHHSTVRNNDQIRYQIMQFKYKTSHKTGRDT